MNEADLLRSPKISEHKDCSRLSDPTMQETMAPIITCCLIDSAGATTAQDLRPGGTWQVLSVHKHQRLTTWSTFLKRQACFQGMRGKQQLFQIDTAPQTRVQVQVDQLLVKRLCNSPVP